MTKQEAIELEKKCDELMGQYLGIYCSVSLALTGRLKVTFGEGYIIINKDYKSASYIDFQGDYDELQEYIESIIKCINENKDAFDRLVWSYEHIIELS